MMQLRDRKHEIYEAAVVLTQQAVSQQTFFFFLIGRKSACYNNDKKYSLVSGHVLVASSVRYRM